VLEEHCPAAILVFHRIYDTRRADWVVTVSCGRGYRRCMREIEGRNNTVVCSVYGSNDPVIA
jgi:hypothetical protein